MDTSRQKKKGKKVFLDYVIELPTKMEAAAIFSLLLNEPQHDT